MGTTTAKRKDSTAASKSVPNAKQAPPIQAKTFASKIKLRTEAVAAKVNAELRKVACESEHSDEDDLSEDEEDIAMQNARIKEISE